MIGAGDRVGAEQRLTVYLNTQHNEVAVAKSKGIAAGRAKRKQAVVPMSDVGNVFGNEGSQDDS